MSHYPRQSASFASCAQKSKSVAKRKRDDKAERAVDMEARQLRQEMKRRGHMTVPKRGEDPEQVRRARLRAKASCERFQG